MRKNHTRSTPLLSIKKTCLFYSALLCVTVIFILTGSELFLHFFQPQPILFPRWVYSRDFGLVLPNNQKMIHYQPGKWQFVYTINEHGNRGRMIPISTADHKINLVILGDSYSMGAGVNDGQEYPAIMNALLGEKFQVINTGVGGWGLTQQIRRFYEFGQFYQPALVLLQYCANDPDDNLRDRVTDVRDGRFIFQPTERQENALRRFIRTSWLLQHSQLYRFLVNTYETIRDRPSTYKEDRAEATPEEIFYNQLLQAFAEDLQRRGIVLWMFSIEGALGNHYPHIRNKVMELDNSGLLEYIDVKPWFGGATGYSSPEGHLWGLKAHRIVGKKLSELVRRRITTSPEDSGTP